MSVFNRHNKIKISDIPIAYEKVLDYKSLPESFIQREKAIHCISHFFSRSVFMKKALIKYNRHHVKASLSTEMKNRKIKRWTSTPGYAGLLSYRKNMTITTGPTRRPYSVNKIPETHLQSPVLPETSDISTNTALNPFSKIHPVHWHWAGFQAPHADTPATNTPINESLSIPTLSETDSSELTVVTSLDSEIDSKSSAETDSGSSETYSDSGTSVWTELEQDFDFSDRRSETSSLTTVSERLMKSTDSFTTDSLKDDHYLIEDTDEQAMAKIAEAKKHEAAKEELFIAAQVKRQSGIKNRAEQSLKNSIVFGVMPQKSPEQQIIDNCNELTSFTQTSLSNGGSITAEAAQILSNALLVKMCPYDDKTPDQGGVVFEQEGGEPDYSKINIILPEESENDQRKSALNSRLQTALIQIKAMLNKHAHNLELRKTNQSQNTNIFVQMEDNGQESFSGDALRAIKEAYNKKSKNPASAKTTNGITIIRQLQPETEEAKKNKALTGFFRWSMENSKEYEKANLFISNILLYAKGVGNFKQSQGVIDFSKLYINKTTSLDSLTTAIVCGKKQYSQSYQTLIQ